MFITPDNKRFTLLSLIESAGGRVRHTQGEQSWLDWFCNDGEPDSFSVCCSSGYIETRLDTESGVSETWITDYGLCSLHHHKALHNVPAAVSQKSAFDRVVTEALRTDIFGGVYIDDYLDISAGDAVDLRVNLTERDAKGKPQWHHYSDIRAEEQEDAVRAVLAPIIHSALVRAFSSSREKALEEALRELLSELDAPYDPDGSLSHSVAKAESKAAEVLKRDFEITAEKLSKRTVNTGDTENENQG